MRNFYFGRHTPRPTKLLRASLTNRKKYKFKPSKEIEAHYNLRQILEIRVFLLSSLHYKMIPTKYEISSLVLHQK